MYSLIFAQIKNKALPNNLQAQQQDPANFLSSILPKFFMLIITIGALAFFFIFVMGAIKWITSGGDKAAVSEARTQILNALIGIIVLFSVFAVAKVIETLFGISLIQINITQFFQ